VTGRVGHKKHGRGGTKEIATLHIRVQAGARKEGILGMMGNQLRVAVSAPPVEGAANRALVRLLARSFDTKPSRIRIVRGAKSKVKTVEMESLTPEALQRRLEKLGGI
jgi:uncharacterized protein (TIGR00251 family)